MTKDLVEDDTVFVNEAPVSESSFGDIELLCGEVVLEKIEYICIVLSAVTSVSLVPGVLIITNYRLCFTPFENNTYGSCKFESIHVPLGAIAKVEKVGSAEDGYVHTYMLNIMCKDTRTLSLGFLPHHHSRRKTRELLLEALSPSSGLERAFVFAHEYSCSDGFDGWNVYDDINEYKRLGVLGEDSMWRITDVNVGFEVSQSYPQRLVVPRVCSDELIREAAKFRGNGRFPALTWRHPKSGASLCRCAQPHVGFSRSRCMEDEDLVAAILAANVKNPSCCHIIDARGKASALGQAALGGGYENTNHYENTQLAFMGIENIHCMRASFERLREFCLTYCRGTASFRHDDWPFDLDNTRWLEHIQCCLNASCRIVSLLEDDGASVIVHCTDGWDRTSQLCTLAELMLDPYYRTIEGFQVLIEKDWLAFGHQFATRCGQYSTSSDEKYSPIFQQWLDSVWQLTMQFPTAFEFNDRYLQFIARHFVSGRFGTFLFDTVCERLQMDLRTRTASVWSHAHDCEEEFRNPVYTMSEAPLRPDCSLKKMLLWVDLYMRPLPRPPIQPVVLRSSVRRPVPEGILAEAETTALTNMLRHADTRINKLARALGGEVSRRMDAEARAVNAEKRVELLETCLRAHGISDPVVSNKDTSENSESCATGDTDGWEPIDELEETTVDTCAPRSVETLPPPCSNPREIPCSRTPEPCSENPACGRGPDDAGGSDLSISPCVVQALQLEHLMRTPPQASIVVEA
eukprot:Rmarinus@m.9124